jgi:hypothetical protein
MSQVSKPQAVTNAVRAIYLALAFGLAAATIWLAMGAGMALPLPLTVFLVPSLFCQFGIPALLVHGISTRKNWARIIYAVFLVLGMLQGALTWFLDANRFPVIVTVEVVLSLVQAYALYLLFTRPSNQWFRSVRAA